MPTSGHKTSRDFTSLVARRMWTDDDKRRLVAEMSMPGANVSEIARRHGVANSLLYRWRRETELAANVTAREQPGAVPEANVAPAFVPVALTPPHLAPPNIIAPCACTARVGVTTNTIGTLDIVLANGRSVRVKTDVDTAALVRIVSALERAE